MKTKTSLWIDVRHIGITLLVIVALLANGNPTRAQANDGVKLVLQITVDGLRGDLLNRYEDGFGKGGFRLLMEKGTVYTNAHYQHANTETIVGHTTQNGSSPCSSGRCRADHCRHTGDDTSRFCGRFSIGRST